MPVVGFIEMIGTTELMVILVIVLIVFGAGRLPEVFASFGKGIRAFKDAQKDAPTLLPPDSRADDDVDRDPAHDAR